MSQRNIRIDTLRGAACILLVSFHLVGSGPTSGLKLDESDPLILANAVFAYLRMPLFSFLSGYVYAWHPYRRDAAAFIRGKARRLLIPMFVVGTLFAILQTITPGTNAGAYDWSMLHILPVSHFWFLESLFLIFVVIAALEHFAAMATEHGFALVFFVAAVVHVAQPLPVHFGLLGATYLFPFVLLGVWCNRFGERRSGSTQLSVGLSLSLLGIAYSAFVAQAMPLRSSAPALAIGLGTCVALLRLKRESAWLAWIGHHSFAIYLFHTVFTGASRILLTSAGVSAIWVLVLVGMLAGTLLPIATELGLRRVPVLGRWVLGESKPKPSLRADATQ